MHTCRCMLFRIHILTFRCVRGCILGVCVCVRVFKYVRMYAYVHIRPDMYTPINISTYVDIYMCMCLYIYMYVYVYELYMYMREYIHIHIIYTWFTVKNTCCTFLHTQLNM